MLPVVPNIVFAPNMTQNANTGRKTQTLLISALPAFQDVNSLWCSQFETTGRMNFFLNSMEFFVEIWQNIKVSSPGGISWTVTEIEYDIYVIQPVQ